ncbi:MAG: histidine kinase [Deltaproteobacteria bacterium]
MLTSELDTAGQVLQDEGNGAASLEEVLRMQNRVLTRTLTSLVLKGSESAKFLDRLLDAITHVLNVHSCAVWSFDQRTRMATLEKTAYNGTILSGLSQLRHPAAGRKQKVKTRLFSAMLKGEPVQIDDSTKAKFLEPRVRRWLRAQRVKSMMCVPLRVGKRMTGALTIRMVDHRGFPASTTHLVNVLSTLIALAVQLNGLLERRQEYATLSERSRLASEMHDSLSQDLTAATLQLEAADHALASGVGKAHQHLAVAGKMIRQSHEELRHSVWALRPLLLEGQTLPEALRKLARRVSRGKSLSARFALRGKSWALSEELESNLLRIAQEAVGNSVLHSRASKINILLAYSRRGIVLSTSDDGVGFRTSAAHSGDGAGLGNMRRRAERIGAKFSIHSSKRRGTQVTVTLPVTSM